MKTPKRINKELLDSELLGLINASTKILPITQADVDSNNNPNGYEYGNVGNAIYRWSGTSWGFIIANDPDIDWTEVKNKPTTFTPSEHSHSDLHEHTNKTILDGITQAYIDTWNTVTDHSHTEADISDLDKYTKLEVDGLVGGKADAVHIHDDMYYTELEVDTLLSDKANSLHNHDGAYFTKSEVTGLLSGKSDTTHTHTDLHTHTNKVSLDKLIDTGTEETYDIKYLKDVEDIKNGYTEGHAHTNLTLLETITQVLIDGWNSAVTHISDAVKHITGEERTLWNTVSGKAEEIHSHTKTDITDLNLDWSGIDDKPLTFPPETHAHDDFYYTEGEIDTKLSSKAEASTLTGHTGNTTVHVTQINKDTWDGKADGTHNHTLASLSEKSYNSLTDKPTIPSAYTHPTYAGDDINVDTGALSGATVISDLDFNITTDTNGHVTDANGVVSTRNLTAADIGAAAASHSHSYLPLAGGTMTGILYPQRNTSYTTGQARRIVLSTGNPSGGGNGDVWIKYT